MVSHGAELAALCDAGVEAVVVGDVGVVDKANAGALVAVVPEDTTAAGARGLTVVDVVFAAVDVDAGTCSQLNLFAEVVTNQPGAVGEEEVAIDKGPDFRLTVPFPVILLQDIGGLGAAIAVAALFRGIINATVAPVTGAGLFDDVDDLGGAVVAYLDLGGLVGVATNTEKRARRIRGIETVRRGRRRHREVGGLNDVTAVVVFVALVAQPGVGYGAVTSQAGEPRRSGLGGEATATAITSGSRRPLATVPLLAGLTLVALGAALALIALRTGGSSRAWRACRALRTLRCVGVATCAARGPEGRLLRTSGTGVSSGPVSPVTPVKPVGPVTVPTGPIGPVGPTPPATPLGPVGPRWPRSPGSPLLPSAPAPPAGPTWPAGPGPPTGPRRPLGPLGPRGPGPQ